MLDPFFWKKRDLLEVGASRKTPNPLKRLAGGPGFEPGLTESESVVLPLDDPPNGSDRILSA